MTATLSPAPTIDDIAAIAHRAGFNPVVGQAHDSGGVLRGGVFGTSGFARAATEHASGSLVSVARHGDWRTDCSRCGIIGLRYASYGAAAQNALSHSYGHAVITEELEFPSLRR